MKLLRTLIAIAVVCSGSTVLASNGQAPSKVRVDAVEKKTGLGVTYIYTVRNEENCHLWAVEIGRNEAAGTSSLKWDPPVGWTIEKGMVQESFKAPSGWKASWYPTEDSDSENYLWLEDVTRKNTLAPHSVTVFEVTVSKENDTYLHNDWSVQTMMDRGSGCMNHLAGEIGKEITPWRSLPATKKAQ